MSSYIINDGQTLEKFLSSVIEGTLTKKRVIREDREKETLKKGEVTVDDVVEKLNTIRSGKSFKDQDVLKSMETYVKDLDSAERTALLAFLKGISEIVTGGVEGKEAFEPSDSPSKVKMEKKPTTQKVVLKPKVFKKPSPPESEKSKPEAGKEKAAEDTTPPAPITAKKK